MKLPGGDLAIVDASKVRDYLLSPEHPVGRFKAAFFARVGYAREDWERLCFDLRVVASSGEATPGPANQFGQKYEICASLGATAPMAEVVTIWIVRSGETTPRFVTAYPR